MNIKKSENIARIILMLIVIGFPLGIYNYRQSSKVSSKHDYSFEIVAAIPEAGGFTPEVIRIPAGETVQFKFSSPDVVHGIAIGPGLGIDIGQINPGGTEIIEIKIDEPGRYTLYCNVWCSPNHWRMRSIIEVYDPMNPDELIISERSDNIIERLFELGIDIDSPHISGEIPEKNPSAIIGKEVFAEISADVQSSIVSAEKVLWNSPFETWIELTGKGVQEEKAWDVVAFLWTNELQDQNYQRAKNLYEKNCAACHGENGDGDVVGSYLQLSNEKTGEEYSPSNFTDLASMYGVSNDVLYAKIMRGGMGTGMPSFGPLFTQEESLGLVNYIRTFSFELP